MATQATQSLADYLSVAPPAIPTSGTNPGPNTTNSQYSFKDITSVNVWAEFTYYHITQRFGNMLSNTQIFIDPIMPISPQVPIKAEDGFAAQFGQLIQPRVRRALRAGFQHLAPQLATMNLTAIGIGIGSSSQIIDQFRPDISFYDGTGVLGTKPNRCPGDLKVSWKWGSNWGNSALSGERTEYLQVLAQVNFYMKQHNARYGFVLTDTELVPIKRLDANGNLLLGQAIQWQAAGPARLTVALGLWYLGMLAASDNDWQLP